MVNPRARRPAGRLPRVLSASAICLLSARTGGAQALPVSSVCPPCIECAAGEQVDDAPRVVRLQIYNQSQMTDTDLAAMVDWSRRIWLPYGVTVERATRPPGVAVVISGEERHPARIGTGTVLGDTIFANGHATPYIRLWLRAAEVIAAGSPRRVAPVMGVALAHELAHYLLDTDRHSSRGLLQAGLSVRLLTQPDLAWLELTRSQRLLVCSAPR